MVNFLEIWHLLFIYTVHYKKLVVYYNNIFLYFKGFIRYESFNSITTHNKDICIAKYIVNIIIIITFINKYWSQLCMVM